MRTGTREMLAPIRRSHLSSGSAALWPGPRPSPAPVGPGATLVRGPDDEAEWARVSEARPTEDGVVASAFELVEIDEVERLLAPGAVSPFTDGERAYAHARKDPARRLAARLAAKRAACRLLGPGVSEVEVEVVRGRYGPPHLALSPAAQQRLVALGARQTLVSLTHERRQAAAVVLFLEGDR